MRKYGRILEISEGAEIMSKRREFNKKYLIGKTFRTCEYSWTERYLTEKTELDKYLIIDGYLIKPDGTEHYFQIRGAKIEEVV